MSEDSHLDLVINFDMASQNWLKAKSHDSHRRRSIKRLDCKGIDVNKQDEPVRSEYRVRAVAIDCEMVGLGTDGKEDALARVSIVDERLRCILDTYVTVNETVTDYRTFVSGITKDLLSQHGRPFTEVQLEVADIIRKRILIGHSIKHDLKVLRLSHPKRRIRDTQRYKPFHDLVGGGNPSLRKLAAHLLNRSIQTEAHNSVEDARTAMQLYLSVRRDWENSVVGQKAKQTNPLSGQSEVEQEETDVGSRAVQKVNNRIKHARYLQRKRNN